MSLIGRSTTDTSSNRLLLRTWRWSTRATRCCSATWPSTARNGDALVLRGAVYAAISIGDSGHGVMETVGVFGEENMEKPWLKYLEIGSLTLNNDDFSLQRNGHFATKVIGKRCENQRRSGDSNRRDVDCQHRDSRQRWDFTISPGGLFSMRFINFS